jgi:flagellar biosynthesis component FlhA
MIADGLRTSAKEGTEFALPGAIAHKIADHLRDSSKNMLARGFQPILVTAPGVRSFIRRMIEPEIPNLIVLSIGELPPTTKVFPMGMVNLEG